MRVTKIVYSYSRVHVYPVTAYPVLHAVQITSGSLNSHSEQGSGHTVEKKNTRAVTLFVNY